MNDTGCTLQTLFSADLTALRYNELTYRGHRGITDITTGNGVMYVDFPSFCEQYQHARDLQSRLMNLSTPLPLSKAKLHTLHGNLLEELRIQQSFIRTKADTEQLIILMTKFTGLGAMERYDDFGSPEAPEGYISRRTGLMPDELATGSPQKYLFWLLTASFHADALVSRLASSVHDWEVFTKFGKFKDILRGSAERFTSLGSYFRQRVACASIQD